VVLNSYYKGNKKEVHNKYVNAGTSGTVAFRKRGHVLTKRWGVFL